MSDELQVLRWSILNIQVCAPRSWDKARVRDETNRANLCGTTNGWQFLTGDGEPEPDADDDPVPNKCDRSATRQHWILWA